MRNQRLAQQPSVVNRFSSVHKDLHRSHFFDSSSLVILWLQELDGKLCVITWSILRWSVDLTVVFFNHSQNLSRLCPFFRYQSPVKVADIAFSSTGAAQRSRRRSYGPGSSLKYYSTSDSPIVGPEKSGPSVMRIPFSPTRPVTVSCL